MTPSYPPLVAELVTALRAEAPDVQLTDDTWMVSVSCGFRRALDIEYELLAAGDGSPLFPVFEVFERSWDEDDTQLDDIRIGSATKVEQAVGLLRARLNTLVHQDSMEG